MERTPPLPVELWEQIPLHVQAVLWEVFDRYEERLSQQSLFQQESELGY
jgi:hypothetical protein